MIVVRSLWLSCCLVTASCLNGGPTGPNTSLLPEGAGGSSDARDAGRDPADAPEPSRGGSAAIADASTGGSETPDGAALPSPEAGDSGAGGRAACEPDAGEQLVEVAGWSVRKRIRSEDCADLVLEEVLGGFGDAVASPMRIRMLSSDGATEHTWTAPSGGVLSDFCRHPSGAVSAVVIAADRTLSLERLSPELTPLGALSMHDALIASDPHVSDMGALDLLANGLAPDAARIASVGESVVATVFTSWNSIIAYRTSFSEGSWGELARTMIEPPVGLTPFLPIGGSFDTFGAMVVWYRAHLDVDEAGNAYVATWANPRRIREHVAVFGDGLSPLFGTDFPMTSDSDVLVTKIDVDGTRVWSRVVGTTYEDEPYAIRAHAGSVAVVGRARRFTGLDNSAWDAFVSVLSTAGELAGSRALPLNGSGIFLAVDSAPGGGWIFGGSDGWSQNPEGLSIVSYGSKLLAVLPAIDAALSRVPLAAGPRHNEIRTVNGDPYHSWYGGHEDGPIMHSGDADRSLIVANGVLGSLNSLP